MADKTKLSYWMGQTHGRKNAAYTLMKRAKNQSEGRGGGMQGFKTAPEVSTPRGTQFAPSNPTVSAPKASTTSGPNVGYKNPRDMAGKTKFEGTTGDKIKLGAAIVGGFAAVPAAVIAAPVAAGAVGVLAAAPGGGAIGAALTGAAGAVTKAASMVSKAGRSPVGKGAVSRAASGYKPVARVPARVADTVKPAKTALDQAAKKARSKVKPTTTPKPKTRVVKTIVKGKETTTRVPTDGSMDGMTAAERTAHLLAKAAKVPKPKKPVNAGRPPQRGSILTATHTRGAAHLSGSHGGSR